MNLGYQLYGEERRVELKMRSGHQEIQCWTFFFLYPVDAVSGPSCRRSDGNKLRPLLWKLLVLGKVEGSLMGSCKRARWQPSKRRVMPSRIEFHTRWHLGALTSSSPDKLSGSSIQKPRG